MFPALTTWQALDLKLKDKLATLWIGGEGGMEKDMVTRKGILFKDIPAAGVHGVNLKSLPGNIVRLSRGFIRSLGILKEFNPDVIFSTGGYLSIPVSLAGLRIPSVLYVPDIQPALALKTVSLISKKIALTVEESRRSYYPWQQRRLEVTGYPLRPEVKQWNKQSGRQCLNLSQSLPTLLVTGGSKGSRSINNALINSLGDLLPKMQIIHLTGDLDWAETQKKVNDFLNDPSIHMYIERYHPYPFLQEMGAALATADLVVSRSGASIFGEYTYFGLPSILVPYPYAWRYQKVNAGWMESHGASVVLEDANLFMGLAPTVLDLMNNKEKLNLMSIAARKLSNDNAAELIADMIIDQVRSKKGCEMC